MIDVTMIRTDVYEWRAIYSEDGSDCLDEHDEDGTPHRFDEIDQDRLLAFMLVPQREGLSTHALQLAEGQRLIFFRRTSVNNTGARAGMPRKAHIIGWQRTVRGENVKSLLTVYENGATLLSDDSPPIVP